jgi:hypothetical protein
MNQQQNNSQVSGIEQSELKAFHTALQQNGFQENDFEIKAISEKQGEQHSSSQHTAQMENHQSQNSQKCGKVAVKNKKTGKEKTYQAGEGNHWVKNFENDLKNHQFK